MQNHVYHIIFHHIILSCIILYHTIQYDTLLYSTLLYHSILYYTVLYYTMLSPPSTAAAWSQEVFAGHRRARGERGQSRGSGAHAAGVLDVLQGSRQLPILLMIYILHHLLYIHIYQNTRAPTFLVYEVYIMSCRMSTINSIMAPLSPIIAAVSYTSKRPQSDIRYRQF